MRISAGRYLNLALGLASYTISVIRKNAVIWAMPAAVGIEITNNCNLRCAECLSGSGKMSRPKGFMDESLFHRTINELRPFLYNVNLYFQGESMMHPGFFSLTEKCRGLRTVLSTNGHFLDEDNARHLALSGITRLTVSLDGFNQESYSSYRKGGDFDRVISGIKNVAQAIKASRSKLKLEIQMLVNRHNEDQIAEVIFFARGNSASLKLKSMQVINGENVEYWLPADRRYRRYIKEGNLYKLNSRLKNRCLRMWLNPVVTWDGNIVPCCFDKDADHIMGNLNRDSFRNVWRSEKYTAFRNLILTNRRGIDICQNCTAGLKKSIF